MNIFHNYAIENATVFALSGEESDRKSSNK